LRTLFSRYPVRPRTFERNGTRQRQSHIDVPVRNILAKQRLLSGFLPFAYFHRKVSLLATQERADQTRIGFTKQSTRLRLASHVFDVLLSSIFPQLIFSQAH